MAKRSLNIKNYFLLDVNVVIRYLILSDTVLSGAVGLLGPVFALFISDFIQSDNPEVVAGIAAAVFLFTKSIMQIPIADFIDRVRGEKDDFWILVIFTILIGIIPLAYLFITTPLQLYVVQFILGVFTAFTFPTYMAIFTRHIDKSKEGTEWGIYFTTTDLTAAIFAAVGGYVAGNQGFPALIILVAIISVAGGLLLLPIKPYIKDKKSKKFNKNNLNN